MKAKRIYRKFIYKFILFLMITVILVIASGFFVIWSLQNQFNSVEFPPLTAKEIIKENPADMELETLLSMGGWIQILDQKLQVIYQEGENLPPKFRYTNKELLAKMGNLMDDRFYRTAAYFPEGSKYYLLLVGLPHKTFRVELNLGSAPEELTGPFYNSLLRGGILLIGLLIINVLLYSYYTARNLSKPLGKLLQGIREKTAGKTGVKVDLTTGNELDEVGQAFNRMVQELEDSKRKEEEVERAKRQILLGISHDIKTPLTSIRGYIEALLDGLVKEESERLLPER